MRDNKQSTNKNATLYRMVTSKHICPYGIKSKDLLKRKGYEVDDNHLKTREETDKFKEEHNVKTTPQTFIDGKRIGGYDDLLGSVNQFFYRIQIKLPEKFKNPLKLIIVLSNLEKTLRKCFSFEKKHSIKCLSL